MEIFSCNLDDYLRRFKFACSLSEIVLLLETLNSYEGDRKATHLQDLERLPEQGRKLFWTQLSAQMNKKKIFFP